MTQPASEVSAERRTQLLDEAIITASSQGAILVSRAGYQAVMDWPRQAATNHVLHGILSLLTCGLWLIIWLLLALADSTNRNSAARGAGRFTLMADEWGRVWSAKPGGQWQEF